LKLEVTRVTSSFEQLRKSCLTTQVVRSCGTARDDV
jgi:hypothetical protein